MHLSTKRICAAALAALMSSFLLVPSSAVIADELKPEDKNGDGVIDVFDYLLAKRETVANSTPVEMTLSGTEVAPGSLATVTMSFASNPGCERLSFLLDYSTDCMITGTPKTKLLLEKQTPYCAYDEELGVVSFSSLDSKLVTDTGNFLQMEFQVPADAEPGTEYSFSLRNTHAYGEDSKEIPVRTTLGSIIVSGDAPLVTRVAEPAANTVTTTTSAVADAEVTGTTDTTEGTTTTTTTTFHMKGIDVSQWQGKIDFQAVADAGTEFVILRAGYGFKASQVDKTFVTNYNNAKAAGIPVGAYWYSYAKNEEEAKLEAAACLEVLGDRKFEFPIAYDFEEPFQMKYSKAKIASIICAFCEELEAHGYYCSVYSFASAFTYNINQTVKERYDAFVAHYGVKKPAYKGPYGVWQYSSTGRVDGIKVNVDRDYAYKNYPVIIKKYHLNGY